MLVPQLSNFAGAVTSFNVKRKPSDFENISEFYVFGFHFSFCKVYNFMASLSSPFRPVWDLYLIYDDAPKNPENVNETHHLDNL